MRIIECYIRGFGGIKELRIEFDDGLCCFVGDNGVGKTTLAAFIKAMLYGLGESRKTSLEENDRKHYTPWDRGPAGGSMTFRARGKTYRVERSFGKRPSEDSFALYDTRLGRRCEDLGENLGEALFGMSAESFERTALFSERNLVPEVDSAAAGLVGTGDGNVGSELSAGALERALDVLDAQRKIYSKKGGGGAIADLKEEIYRINAELERLEAIAQRARETEGAIAELEARRELAKGKALNISERESRLRERAAAERYDSRITELRREISELNGRKDELFSFFGGSLPSRDELEELSYKRRRADELRAMDKEERCDSEEYSSLSALFAGKCDAAEAERARGALAITEELRGERASRIRSIFSKRIPSREETDRLISEQARSSSIGILSVVFGILILTAGILAGTFLFSTLYAVCAVGALVCVFGIGFTAHSRARAEAKRRKALEAFLCSVGERSLLQTDGLVAAVELRSLIDDAERLRDKEAQAEAILGEFCSKFSTRVESYEDFARSLIEKYDRMTALRKKGNTGEGISPAVLGEKLLLDIAEQLASYDIRSDDPLGEVRGALAEYERVTSELVARSKELATLSAMRGLDAPATPSEDTEEGLRRARSEVSSELSGIDGELAVLAREYDADIRTLSSREILIIERERLRERLGVLEGELRAVQGAAEYLSRAAESINSKYLERALARFREYGEAMGADCSGAEMGTDFSTSLARGAGTHSTESFSRGTRDAFRLAGRLAILDTLYSQEEAPLILDDPFASFDDGRCADAVRLLERLGNNRQIIYLTCSETRATRDARRIAGRLG